MKIIICDSCGKDCKEIGYLNVLTMQRFKNGELGRKEYQICRECLNVEPGKYKNITIKAQENNKVKEMVMIDIPMPKSCDDCFALNEGGDYPLCLISHHSRGYNGYNFNTRENRMPDCPLKIGGS